MASAGAARGRMGEYSPSQARRSDMRSRFRDRSLSTSMSSLSGVSDRVAPSPSHRGLLARLGSRPEVLSVEEGTLSGKSASLSSMLPLERSECVTPLHSSTACGRSFASSENSVGYGGSEEGGPHGGGGVSGGGGDGGGGSAKGRPGKRGFKRMFSNVPSPSHFRRSMSFTSSMSAISHAATRVAAGAMTPISRRRQRRDRRSSGEGASENGSARGESRGRSSFGGLDSGGGSGTDGWGSRGGGGGSRSGGGKTHRGSRENGQLSFSDRSRDESRSGSHRSGQMSSESSNSRGSRGGGGGGGGGGGRSSRGGGGGSRDGGGSDGVRKGVADYAAQASAMADAAGLARQHPERGKPPSLEAGANGCAVRKGDSRRESGSGVSSSTERSGGRRSISGSARGSTRTATAAATGTGAPPSATTDGRAKEGGGGSRSGRRRSSPDSGGKKSGAESTPHSVWSWESVTSAKAGDGSRAGADGRKASARKERSASGKQEDGRGRPPSHFADVGRTPRAKQTTATTATAAAPPQAAPVEIEPGHIVGRSFQDFRERVRERDPEPSASTMPTPSPRSSFGSDWSVSTPSRRSGSPRSALPSPTNSGKKGIAGPLLTRGRSFFGTGTGGASHMFASSPRGARAARRARSFSQHRTTTSVWARADTPKKEGAMMQSAALAANMDRTAVSPEAVDADTVLAATAVAEARARESSWEEAATEEATTAEEMEGSSVRGSSDAAGSAGVVGAGGVAGGGGVAGAGGAAGLAGSGRSPNTSSLDGGAGGAGKQVETGVAVNNTGVAGSSGGGSNPPRRSRAPSENQGGQARGRSPSSANGYPPPMPAACAPRSVSTPPAHRGRRHSPTFGAAAASTDYLSPSSSDAGACSPPVAVCDPVSSGGGGGSNGRGHTRSPSVGSARSGSRLAPSLVLARAGLRSVPRAESAFGSFSGSGVSRIQNDGSAKARVIPRSASHSSATPSSASQSSASQSSRSASLSTSTSASSSFTTSAGTNLSNSASTSFGTSVSANASEADCEAASPGSGTSTGGAVWQYKNRTASAERDGDKNGDGNKDGGEGLGGIGGVIRNLENASRQGPERDSGRESPDSFVSDASGTSCRSAHSALPSKTVVVAERRAALVAASFRVGEGESSPSSPPALLGKINSEESVLLRAPEARQLMMDDVSAAAAATPSVSFGSTPSIIPPFEPEVPPAASVSFVSTASVIPLEPEVPPAASVSFDTAISIIPTSEPEVPPATGSPLSVEAVARQQQTGDRAPAADDLGVSAPPAPLLSSALSASWASSVSSCAPSPSTSSATSVGRSSGSLTAATATIITTTATSATATPAASTAVAGSAGAAAGRPPVMVGVGASNGTERPPVVSKTPRAVAARGAASRVPIPVNGGGSSARVRAMAPQVSGGGVGGGSSPPPPTPRNTGRPAAAASVSSSAAAAAAAAARLNASSSAKNGGGRPGPRLTPEPAEDPVEETRQRVQGQLERQQPEKMGDSVASAATGGDSGSQGPRPFDDLPPAEMGALGVSLECAICGAAETAPIKAGGMGKGAGRGFGARSDWKKAEFEAAAKAVAAGVEVKRCSRCRRGCCESCFKWLPVFCRGPRVVVPVCRDCFRCVDFENRWHNHLVATSQERNRKLSPAAEGRPDANLRTPSTAADKGSRSPSVSPGVGVGVVGAAALAKGGAASGGGNNFPGEAPTLTSAALSASSASPSVGRGAMPSFLRTSSRLFRRSLSGAGGGDAFATGDDASSSSSSSDTETPTRSTPGDSPPPPLSPTQLFETGCRPRSLPNGKGRGQPVAAAVREAAQLQAAQVKVQAAQMPAAPLLAATTSSSWFGSSIGSALSSLSSSAIPSGGGGGGAGAGIASAFSSTRGVGSTTPTAMMVSAPFSTSTSRLSLSSPMPSPGTSYSAGAAAVDPRNMATPSALAAATAAAKPWTVTGKTAPTVNTASADGYDCHSGGIGGGGGGIGGRGRGKTSPARMSPIHLRGRDPSDCPCGAAALYNEVMGGDRSGGAAARAGACPAVAGGVGVGGGKAAAKAKAQAEEARAAADKLRRAKAYAHLLTRGCKALAYADLQAKAYKFLREQAAAAIKLERDAQSSLSLKSKAAAAERPWDQHSQSFSSAPPPPPPQILSSSSSSLAARGKQQPSSPLPPPPPPPPATAAPPAPKPFGRGPSPRFSPVEMPASATVVAQAVATVARGTSNSAAAAAERKVGKVVQHRRRHSAPAEVLEPDVAAAGAAGEVGPVGGAVGAVRVEGAAGVVKVAASELPSSSRSMSASSHASGVGPAGGRGRLGVAAPAPAPPPPPTPSVSSPSGAAAAMAAGAAAAVAAAGAGLRGAFAALSPPKVSASTPSVTPPAAAAATNAAAAAEAVPVAVATTVSKENDSGVAFGAAAEGGPTAVWGREGEEAIDVGEDAARRRTREALELVKAEEEEKKEEEAARIERARTDTMIENLRRAREANSRKSSASSSYRQRWMTDDDAASSFGDADTFTDDEFGGRDAWAESSQERGRVKSEAAVGEETKMEATRSDGGRLPHHRPSSSFSALGVPAIVRLDGTGPGGARAMGLPSWYRDTGDEMRQRVKDREALFEKMLTGPGITAMKFPRGRGKPKLVLLTLVSPAVGWKGRGRARLGRGGGGGGAGGVGAAAGGGGGGNGVADMSQSRKLQHQKHQKMGHLTSPRSHPSPFFGRGAASPFGRPSASASAIVGRPATNAAALGREMKPKSSPKLASSSAHAQSPSLDTLLELELVWNRQRGGKGSLRVREVVDALAGAQSQVLKPVCEELRRRAVLRGGAGGGGVDEEDTFVSLLTRTRTLDLKFSTVVTRDCFLSAFKTFAWEKAGSMAPIGDAPPPLLQRHYSRKDGVGETGGGASAKLSRDFDQRPFN